MSWTSVTTFRICYPPSSPSSQVVSEGSACDPHSTLQSGDELVENEEVAKMQKGRQFVIQELIATERDYIRDLECVLNVSVLYTRSISGNVSNQIVNIYQISLYELEGGIHRHIWILSICLSVHLSLTQRAIMMQWIRTTWAFPWDWGGRETLCLATSWRYSSFMISEWHIGTYHSTIQGIL